MNPHEKAAKKIIERIIHLIKQKGTVYFISVAGESGSGKSETGKALEIEFNKHALKALLIEQDNYFFLPPKANHDKRISDSTWLGPRKEVNLAMLNEIINQAIEGNQYIDLLNIEYQTDVVSHLKTDISDIKVFIFEGTYTSLLKKIDTRIFIDADYNDTLIYRQLRNRGNEVNEPFVEGILETEHKIIAGHIFLADFIITKEYEIVEI